MIQKTERKTAASALKLRLKLPDFLHIVDKAPLDTNHHRTVADFGGRLFPALHQALDIRVLLNVGFHVTPQENSIEETLGNRLSLTHARVASVKRLAHKHILPLSHQKLKDRKMHFNLVLRH